MSTRPKEIGQGRLYTKNCHFQLQTPLKKVMDYRETLATTLVKKKGG